MMQLLEGDDVEIVPVASGGELTGALKDSKIDVVVIALLAPAIALILR